MGVLSTDRPNARTTHTLVSGKPDRIHILFFFFALFNSTHCCCVLECVRACACNLSGGNCCDTAFALVNMSGMRVCVCLRVSVFVYVLNGSDGEEL